MPNGRLASHRRLSREVSGQGIHQGCGTGDGEHRERQCVDLSREVLTLGRCQTYRWDEVTVHSGGNHLVLVQSCEDSHLFVYPKAQ